jgi:hypothetical protein
MSTTRRKDELEDGRIDPDTKRGELLGFTKKKFDGYLWKVDSAIYISYIASKRRGNFRKLVSRIHALGFTVKVPTPLGRMQDILLRNGYIHTIEFHDYNPEDHVEVWVLDPPKKP